VAQPLPTLQPLRRRHHAAVTNLVMSGGSLKGVSFIGCIRKLEETGVLPSIMNYYGTSFGSLILFMSAIGCSSDEMMENLIACIAEDGRKAAHRKPFIKVVMKCIERGGIDDGAILLECVKRPLIKKMELSDITFLELAKRTGKNLVVAGSNLSRSRREFFSVDDTPDMSVILALRISASIPFVFQPVVHNAQVYVDGALFSNFPIDYVESVSNAVTLGILIDDFPLEDKEDAAEKKSPEKKTLSLLDLIMTMWRSVLVRLNSSSSLSGRKDGATHIVRIRSDDLMSLVVSSSLGFSFESMRFSLEHDEARTVADHGYASLSRSFFDDFDDKNVNDKNVNDEIDGIVAPSNNNTTPSQ
jgi:predicted acylesterase/phospholipase RssA